MDSKIVRYLFIIGIVAIGSWITLYYWSNNTLNTIKYVPIYLMVLTLVYILLQIGKRYLFKKQNWWDWLYYIGLAGMMLGVFFASEKSLELYNSITDYSIVFLIVPGLIDLFDQLQKKKTS